MLFDLVRAKWKYIAFIVLFSLAFNSSILSILGVRSSEVMYDYDVLLALCLSGMKSCPYSGEVQVANMGDVMANNLVFDVENMPESITVSFRVMELVASAVRREAPLITKFDGGQSFSIDNLAPGVLVLAEYSGTFPSERRGLIRDISVHGTGEAAMVYGDPHGTIFGRFISALIFW